MNILRLSHNVKRNMNQYDYSSKTPQHEGDSETDDVHLKGDVELDFADERAPEPEKASTKIVEEPTTSKTVEATRQEEKKISAKYFHPQPDTDTSATTMTVKEKPSFKKHSGGAP